MLNGIDHALFAILLAFFPIWAVTFGFRRLKRAPAEEVGRVRLSLYRRAIAIQWLFTGALIALWIARGRSWSVLYLEPRLTGGLVGVALGIGLATFLVNRQRLIAMSEPETMRGIRDRYRRLELMLPHNPQELWWFMRLSITAGLCEEMLYRGFLFWYLGHWLAPIPAAGVAAIVFGIGHSYQGVRGVLLTTAVGAFLGFLVLLTGSLFASMAIHILMDVYSGAVGYAAFRHDAIAEGVPATVPEPSPVHDPIM